MKRIAIFASGSGTNAENIIKYFQGNKSAEVVLVLSNNPEAFVLNRASELNVKTIVFDKNQLNDSAWALENLSNLELDLVVLAGFLLKFPPHLLNMFQNKVLNIHPALLPRYGGKGMYGTHVHKTVVANKETESGITIHYVNEHYDEGAIIFQAKCSVLQTDTFEDVAAKINQLEFNHFPQVIQNTLSKNG